MSEKKLNIKIEQKGSAVMVYFSESVTNFGFVPDAAESFARAILACADDIRRKRSTGLVTPNGVPIVKN